MSPQATREFMAMVFCLSVFVVVVGHCVGCKALGGAAEEVAQAAEKKFEADMMWCVSQRYPLDAETDACLDAVRHHWGIETVRVRDAGGQ
jgi:hypothetical protein